MPKKPGLLRRRAFAGRAEAHLVALSRSEPSEGRDRWRLPDGHSDFELGLGEAEVEADNSVMRL